MRGVFRQAQQNCTLSGSLSNHGKLSMECKTFSEWDQLPRSSEALFTLAEKESLFFSQAWLKNLATTALGEGEHLLLVCVIQATDAAEKNVTSEETVLAILPLITHPNKQWTSLHHLYTSLYTVLMSENNQAKNNQAEIIDCLAQGLSQLPFERLSLEPIAQHDNNLIQLQLAMESRDVSYTRYARFFNWYEPVQGQTFADYWQARPSKVRNTIARKQRKLAREQDYTIRLYAGDEIQAEAMADFNAVYKASWKATEQHGNVLQGFTDSFSQQGWTRLGILYIDDQPVAAQMWFVVHKKASIFKLAYDEAWKHYSAGSILTQTLMEYVIETDKVEEIDFLTGNDRYKQDWMSERRQRWRMVFMRKDKDKFEEQKTFLQKIWSTFLKRDSK